MGIQWDQLEPATGDVTDDTQLAALQPTNEGGTRKLKRFSSAVKFTTYFLKTLTDATFAFLNGIQLSSGRIAMQDQKTGTVINSDGWYKFLEVEAGDLDFDSAGCNFGVIHKNGYMTGKIVASDANTVRDFSNTTFKITGQSDFSNTFQNIKGFRFGFDPANSAKGFIMEVKLTNSSGAKAYSQLLDNFSTQEVTVQKGWKLLDNFVASDGLLPDGVTAATFLEAGAELQLNNSTTRLPLPILATYLSDDKVGLTFLWGQIPKQGSTFNIDYTGGNIRVVGNGISVTLDATFTESTPVITGQNVAIELTKVGAFSGLANYGLVVNGFGVSIKGVIS